jgi:hypothetical protein
MTDFYNGASEDIEDLFGEGSHQLSREPNDVPLDQYSMKLLSRVGFFVSVIFINTVVLL